MGAVIRIVSLALCAFSACFPLYAYRERAEGPDGPSGANGMTGATGATGTTGPTDDALQLALSRTSVTLLAGDRVSVALTVVRPDGITGPITLAVSGAPSGVTVDAPAIAAGEGAGAIVLSTGAAPPVAAAAPMQITASADGATSATATLSVFVTASERLSVAPSMLTVTRGQQVSFAATLVRDASFSGVVTVSVIGVTNELSGAATVTLQPADTLASFTFTTGGPQLPGTIPLQVRTTHAGLAIADRAVTITLRPVPGSPDTTIGTGGVRQDAIGDGPVRAVRAIAESAGTVLVLAETVTTPQGASGPLSVMRLLRYGDSGAPAVVGTVALVTPSEESITARGVAIDGSGRFLLAGETSIAGSTALVLARLSTTGALDATFGAGGLVVVTPLMDGVMPGATDLQVCSVNGVFVRGARVIVVGQGAGPGFTCSDTANVYAVALAFDDDGTVVADYFGVGHALATSQKEGGAVQERFDGSAENAMGEVLVFGNSQPSAADTRAFAFRYDTLDPPAYSPTDLAEYTYSTDVTPGADRLLGATAAANGAWYLAGSANRGWGVSHALVLRLRHDGTLDPAFTAAHFLPYAQALEATLTGVAVDASSRPVFVGTSVEASSRRFFAMRMTAGGLLDASFAQSGAAVAVHGAGVPGAPVIAIDAAQRIWAFSGITASADLVAARWFSE